MLGRQPQITGRTAWDISHIIGRQKRSEEGDSHSENLESGLFPPTALFRGGTGGAARSSSRSCHIIDMNHRAFGNRQAKPANNFALRLRRTGADFLSQNVTSHSRSDNSMFWQTERDRCATHPRKPFARVQPYLATPHYSDIKGQTRVCGGRHLRNALCVAATAVHVPALCCAC
jgi:hypothetical protein